MTRLIGLWVLLFLSLSLSAAADDTVLYRTGVEAFNAGDFEQALTCFKQALARGNQAPGLYYNLGVTAYKTGRYDQAIEAFGHLVEDPAWGSLALYNLGLTSEAGGQRKSAIDYYSRAREKAGESRIAWLAALKLKTLLPPAETVAVRPWYGIFSMGAGYDDNALLAPDDAVDQVGEEEDGFVEFYAATGRYLKGGRHKGVRLDGGLYARCYVDETVYNTAVVFAGINRNRQYDQWQTRIGLTVEADFDDDGHYATVPAVEVVAEQDFSDYRFRLYNTVYWVEARDPYAYLTGFKNRIGTEIVRFIPGGRVSAACEAEYNDRDDLQTAEEFFSYSPLRGKIRAEIDYRLAQNWRVLLRGGYRVSRYPDANRQVNDDASITTEKREDDRLNLSVRGEYALTDHFDLFSEYRHTDNDSNFSRYAYTSNQVMAGVTITY